MTAPILVELCAGTAAVSLAALGGRSLVTYQGNKHGLRAPILEAMGLQPGLQLGGLLWVDPGPYGWLWGELLRPGGVAQAIADVRLYQGLPPRQVWDDLRSRPALTPGQWLLAAAWTRRGNPAFGWYCGPDVVRSDPRRRARKGSNSITLQGVVRRLEQLQQLGPLPVTVHWGDARDIAPAAGCKVYIDPPYVRSSGYGDDLAREAVLQLALQWHLAGSQVYVSEGEPLPLPGWAHTEITRQRRGARSPQSRGVREWLTCSPGAISCS